MFAGRDTYAARIQSPLVGTGKIFKNISNVNQTVKRLLKHGEEFLVFKRKYRKEKERGRKAEIYTASLDPIFVTLRVFDIDFDEEVLPHVLERLSAGNDFFPQYLTNLFDISILRTSAWHITLANYFTYIAELLRTSRLFSGDNQIDTWPYINLQTTSIPKENVDSLLSRNPDLANRFSSMAVGMTLPQMRLNPKFKSFLSEAMAKLDNLHSDSTKALKFLHGFKEVDEQAREMGLESIYALPSEIKKVLLQVEKWKNKLEKIESQLGNIDEQSRKEIP